MGNGDLVNQKPAGLDISAAGELQVASTATAVLQEIQGTIFLAKRYPRNINEAIQGLEVACKRKEFANKADYAFPRGGRTIRGASVNLARVAAQCYGNMRWGLDIMRDDIDSMTIRGWAWDVQNNNKVTADDTFKKLIQRKDKKSGKTIWKTPDERDLRELVNRRGAILVRNCLLQLMPVDYIEDARITCYDTQKGNIADPNVLKKQLITRLTEYGVSIDRVNEYLGHSDWTKDDLLDLRAILTTIKEGASTINDYFGSESDKAEEVKKPNLSTADMSPGNVEDHQPVSGKLKSGEKVDTDTGEIKEKPDETETPLDEERASENQIDAIKKLRGNKAFKEKTAKNLREGVDAWLKQDFKPKDEALNFIQLLNGLPDAEDKDNF